jgi:hypothetical protein
MRVSNIKCPLFTEGRLHNEYSESLEAIVPKHRWCDHAQDNGPEVQLEVKVEPMGTSPRSRDTSQCSMCAENGIHAP